MTDDVKERFLRRSPGLTHYAWAESSCDGKEETAVGEALARL